MHVTRTILYVLGTVVLVSCTATADTPTRQADTSDSVDYAIIVTGNELLSGVYADGHTLFLTKTLRPLGLHCVSSVSVDDQADDIRQALQFTSSHADLIIVTGGLGPTDSDITRDVLADYTGIPLREHPDVLRHLEKRFNTSRDRLRSNLRRQTRVPVQGTYLSNNFGTSVGLVFEAEEQVIVALPGPPRELQPMVRDQLIPYLARKYGVQTLGASLTVRFVGLGQSQIDQQLKDQKVLPKDVMQTSQFESGRVDFTFSLPGNTDQDRRRLEKLGDDLLGILGNHIYALDASTTLEEAAVRKLTEVGASVVLVEVGSGGCLAHGFSQIPSGQRALTAAFITSDPERLPKILDIPSDRWQATNGNDRWELVAQHANDQVPSDWVIVVGQRSARDEQHTESMPVLIRYPNGAVRLHTLPAPGHSPAALSTPLFDLLRRVDASKISKPSR